MGYDPETLKAAIEGGHLPCVKILCEKVNSQLSGETLVHAAKHAQAACVAYLAPLLLPNGGMGAVAEAERPAACDSPASSSTASGSPAPTPPASNLPVSNYPAYRSPASHPQASDSPGPGSLASCPDGCPAGPRPPLPDVGARQAGGVGVCDGFRGANAGFLGLTPADLRRPRTRWGPPGARAGIAGTCLASAPNGRLEA